jgi:hypothetical protein
MKVKDLIKTLQAMPQDADVEVNDNNGGEVYTIYRVDYFPADEQGTEVVMIQVNCD